MNRLSFWGRSEKIAIFFTLSPNRESVHRLVLGRLTNGEGLNPRGLLIGIEKSASKHTSSADQNTFYIYWFLTYLQNAIINRNNFNTSVGGIYYFVCR